MNKIMHSIFVYLYIYLTKDKGGTLVMATMFQIIYILTELFNLSGVFKYSEYFEYTLFLPNSTGSILYAIGIHSHN